MSLFLKTTGGLIATAFYMGYRKLHELKILVKQLDFQLNEIFDIKLNIVKNFGTFKANFTVFNQSNIELNVQTFGLVNLRRVLFYDLQGQIIAAANINLSAIDIARGGMIQLNNILFETNLTGGISKVKSYLNNKDNNSLQVVLEFEAFNKIYTTNIK